MIINQLIVAKTKSDMVFLLVKKNILIDTSQYFVHVLSSITHKSQLTLNMQYELSKIFYNDCGELVSTTIRFSLKNLFSDSLIFTNEKDSTIE